MKRRVAQHPASRCKTLSIEYLCILHASQLCSLLCFACICTPACYTWAMDKTTASRKGLVSLDEAITILKEFLPVFGDCLDQAWDFVEDVFNDRPERRVAFRATTRANMLYDRLAQVVEQSLDDHPRVKISHRGRMLRLVIDDALQVRFKKLDENHRARNVRTSSQLSDYFQLRLPGMEEPELTKLVFGYRLNATETAIDGRFVTCPKSWQENHWVLALDEEASSAMPLFTSDIEEEDDVEIVVKAKHAAKRKGSTSA